MTTTNIIRVAEEATGQKFEDGKLRVADGLDLEFRDGDFIVRTGSADKEDFNCRCSPYVIKRISEFTVLPTSAQGGPLVTIAIEGDGEYLASYATARPHEEILAGLGDTVAEAKHDHDFRQVFEEEEEQGLTL